MLEMDNRIVRFRLFEETGLVHHGVSTRIGGVSQGPYSTMNLSFARGDDPEAVHENFRRFCRIAGVETASLVFSDQVHEDRVVHVGTKDRGKGFSRPSDIIGADGLSTDVPDVTLTTFYADCVPLFFLDVKRKAIALSHAGWRGTLKDMAGKTIAGMQSRYGTRPEDLVAGIGPSIGPCCYEVSEEIAGSFLTAFGPGAVHGRMLDLQAANRIAMETAGLLPENIEAAGLCTRCNAGLFHSHRAAGPDRGSLAAMLSIRK